MLQRCVTGVRRWGSAATAALVAVAVACSASLARAQGPEIPEEFTINMESYFLLGVTQIVALIVVCLGAWIAFMALRKGLTWMRRTTG